MADPTENEAQEIPGINAAIEVFWPICSTMEPSRQIIYDKLKGVARAQDLIYYQQVGNLVGLDMQDPGDRWKISQLLGNINEEEVTKHQRPMLSAIVVMKDNEMPGLGFWVCARRLGLYTGSSEPEELEFFWCDQVRQVYDAARA